jgi:ribulose 1,5-bisphosphate carboxylase large subunit-like protein
MEVLYQLLSRKLILKMARFCGVDIIYGGTPVLPSGGAGRYNLAHIMDIYDRHRVLRGNLPHVNASLPTVTTSIHPGNIGSLYFLLGEDIGIFVGGAIVAHPKGIEAGAKLVRKAIDEAVRENFDVIQWIGSEGDVLDSRGWKAVNPKDFQDPLLLGMSRLFRAL